MEKKTPAVSPVGVMPDNLKHPLDPATNQESPERLLKVARIEKAPPAAEEPEEQQDLVVSESELSMNLGNPRVQRYLVALEYIGTRFSGSQQQSTCRTVVGTLQDAFHKFVGQPVSILCSSRTDAGVHALSNVCHVDVERISKRKPGEVLPPHEPDVVKKAVNHFLQKNGNDVMIIDVRCVPSNFHARYRAQERTYFYRLLLGPDPLSILEKDRAWHIPEELELRSMQEACKVLVGSHDFSSFRATGCQVNEHVQRRVLATCLSNMSLNQRRRNEHRFPSLSLVVDRWCSLLSSRQANEQAISPIRTLDELNVIEVPSTPYFPSVIERVSDNLDNGDALLRCSQTKTETAVNTTNIGEALGSTNGDSFGVRRRHRCFVVTARARAFLYHQVRLLVGVLKCVGTGELTVSDVEGILKAKTVTAAKPMAPASGLYLAHVKYEFP